MVKCRECMTVNLEREYIKFLGIYSCFIYSMNNNNSGLSHILAIWLLCKFSVTVDNVYEDDKASYNNKNNVLISSVNIFNVFKLQNGANLYIKHILKKYIENTHLYIYKWTKIFFLFFLMWIYFSLIFW